MTPVRERAHAVARSWTRRLVRVLLRGCGGSAENAAVVRCMGQLVPLGTRPAARHLPSRPRPDRSDRLAEWTRSGDLSRGQAELLITLDETTSWQV